MSEKLSREQIAMLKLLSSQFPDIPSVSTEIINLQAILDLPKGTEHFISDLHGEYEAVNHILNNASGIIREKIDEQFGSFVEEDERAELATIVYYPVQKLAILKAKYENHLDEWYRITMLRLMTILKTVSFKYSKSKVRRSLPLEFAYIIEELLYPNDEQTKDSHYKSIFKTIIEIGRADAFIEALSNAIKHMIVDKLHVLGDVFDRGPGAQFIMEKLMNFHSIDFVWGNHDMLWIGAASGNEACIANMLNVTLSYANVDTLENGYGISLRPLMAFAEKTYGDSMTYKPKIIEENKVGLNDVELVSKLRRAAAILQFKLEGQTILRHPEYGMDDRLVLDKIDFKKKTLTVYGNTYELKDCDFPTIDPRHPYDLTPDERALMDQIKESFLRSEVLRTHIKFLIDKGCLYRICNGNLLMHGCLPINDDLSPMEFEFSGKKYSGKKLLDYCDKMVRAGFYGSNGTKEKNDGIDMMWWLWCGKNSPVFGKTRMTTFERLLIVDKKAHFEPKNPFYDHVNDKKLLELLIKEFDLNPVDAHIIVGHIPVKSVSGESPKKCDGRILMIDGGFCKAYQPETGIAGYTLIYNSYGMRIISHEAFTSIEQAVWENKDIVSISNVVDTLPKRKYVRDTDDGVEMADRVSALKKLLQAYRTGEITQTQSSKKS